MKKYLHKAYNSLEEISHELSDLYVVTQDEEILREWEILQKVRSCFHNELNENKLWKEVLN